VREVIMPEKSALEAEKISKVFGDLQAVKDLSLTVNEGDIYGFLGPNGAGKTTSIRMMLGLIEASSGTARIFGKDIKKDFKKAIRMVGAFVEGPAFYPYMSGKKNLRLFGRLSGGVMEDRINDVLDMVGLGRRGDHKVKGYSQGMRQRLGIGLALLHNPKVLILDEPTNGLDPQGIREIRNLIRHLRDELSTTVFLSSHLLGEMELICDRISIIFRGEIIKEGKMDDLIGSGADIVSITVDDSQDKECIDKLKSDFDIEAELVRQGVIEFLREDIDLYPINKALIEKGIKVSSISSRSRTLEEYFVELTGESQDVF
jgi:ABC-2 type transport system ATP-binding protein